MKIVSGTAGWKLGNIFKKFEADHQIDPDPVMFAMGWLFVVRFS